MISLCYKQYPYKMSLAAMKQFKQATGKDLWCTLIQFLECWHDSAGKSQLTRARKAYEVVDFETASHVFHSLIQAEDKSIPLIEIEDAMFKVGWLPNDHTGNMSDPYPLVLVALGHAINKQFEVDANAAKK